MNGNLVYSMFSLNKLNVWLSLLAFSFEQNPEKQYIGFLSITQLPDSLLQTKALFCEEYILS